jgi:hypothetical protein
VSGIIQAVQETIDQNTMPASLQDKLALMIWYLEEVRQRRRSSDPVAFESFLDDTEVSAWLEAMNRSGRIVNTRFTNKR